MSGFDSFLGKPIVIKELERVFSNYLRSSKVVTSNKKTVVQNSNIKGLDSYKLTQELMLSDSELLMLANLFIKKMSKQIPELEEAILVRDYSKIALIAHSIKGSSGNFRLEDVQDDSAELEKWLKKEIASIAMKKYLKR